MTRDRLQNLRNMICMMQYYEATVDGHARALAQLKPRIEELVAWIENIECPVAREIIRLRYVRGLNYVQIAHRLDMSSDAARMTHNRYIKRVDCRAH